MKSLSKRAARLGAWMALAFLALSPLVADASPYSAPYPFPMTPRVARMVSFWESIFIKYPNTTYVIHDAYRPHLVLDIIDFRVFATKFRKGRAYSRAEMEQVATRYMENYKKAVRNVRRGGKDVVAKGGAMERRVWQVYGTDSDNRQYLMASEPNLRLQSGMADEFKRAVGRAKTYLPFMERTFKENGLPVDLTRIAFIESMFNLNAVSKVGASGIWQFMPDTAQNFMLLNPFIDERNSPYKATRAAARLLRENFQLLRTWPLAITAYNHGTVGMQRAVKKFNSRNMDVVLDRYKSPSFGFASRNFFAEFVAARNVYNRFYDRSNATEQTKRTVAHIRLERPISIGQLVKHTPLDETLLAQYNKCLKPVAFSRYRSSPLPRNYELIVPIEMEPHIKQAINRMGVATIERKASQWKR